jgi:hypothetical protein
MQKSMDKLILALGWLLVLCKPIKFCMRFKDLKRVTVINEIDHYQIAERLSATHSAGYSAMSHSPPDPIAKRMSF